MSRNAKTMVNVHLATFVTAETNAKVGIQTLPDVLLHCNQCFKVSFYLALSSLILRIYLAYFIVFEFLRKVYNYGECKKIYCHPYPS